MTHQSSRTPSPGCPTSPMAPPWASWVGCLSKFPNVGLEQVSIQIRYIIYRVYIITCIYIITYILYIIYIAIDRLQLAMT